MNSDARDVVQVMCQWVR